MCDWRLVVGQDDRYASRQLDWWTQSRMVVRCMYSISSVLTQAEQPEPQHPSPRNQPSGTRSRYTTYPLLCHLEAFLRQSLVNLLQARHGL
jgi:hypothetical protein